MMSMSGARCDCCGLPLSSQMGEDCPRCGYPIALFKEEQFLISSLHDLRRVADHGGANITVTQLMRHYQSRLNFLRHVQQVPAPPVASVSQTETVQALTQPSREMLTSAQPVAPVVQPSVPIAARVSLAHEAPARVFSLKAFFADQTINIVVSLAAFLILIGTLGYVATSNLSDLFLSFAVMFIAHAIFGLIGVLAYRFRSRLYSLQIIAVVYTAIFALLVPLVGFSGYRLVAGQIVELSPSALVAIAAVYAAIVYGVLAVYQKFAPFGYLSVVAQAVATLAIASAFHLGYWWWPSVLLLPAFLALLALPDRFGHADSFTGTWEILRAPVRALMFACVGVCGIGAVLIYLYSLGLDIAHQAQSEVRFSLLCVLLLLLIWVCLFVWRTQRLQWAQSIAYLFLASTLAFSYAFEFRQVGYVLMLTGVAVCYHGLTMLAPQILQRSGLSELHLEGIALVLVAIVPLIAEPFLPVEVLVRAYVPSSSFVAGWETLAEIIALLVGVALTISIALHRTGWQGTPEKNQKHWPWLLLLSGFLLDWAYGLIGLSLGLEPVWWFFGFTLALVACAVAARHFVGPTWAHPVDVLALIEAVVTIGLGLNNVDHSIFLLLFFAALSYSMLLYQRRQSWLFLPLILMLLASPFLLLRMRVLLIACIVLPFVSAIIRNFITNRWHVVRVSDQAEAKPGSVLPWEWPLVVSAILYGLIFTAGDSLFSTSVVQAW